MDKSLCFTSSSSTTISHTPVTQLTSPAISCAPSTQITLNTSSTPQPPGACAPKSPAEGNMATLISLPSKDCISLYSLMNQLPTFIFTWRTTRWRDISELVRTVSFSSTTRRMGLACQTGRPNHKAEGASLFFLLVIYCRTVEQL